MELFRFKKPINLMGKARYLGILSLTLVALSWGLILTKGFNYGIDFVGGTVIQIKYDKAAPLEKIRAAISKDKRFSEASVTEFGSVEEIVIKTKNSSKNVNEDVGKEVSKLLKDTGNLTIRRVDMIGPKIGAELREKGLKAALFAIIGILLYVTFRFEWRFAFASVVALVHDVSITMGALVLFNVTFDLNTLAAILTILGYSLNDTIIVFDRIRETLTKTKESDLFNVINESVTKTLSRTTLTSLTTFFVVLVLYLFGGEILKSLSFTLLIGVIVGTYSSIFVASPLLKWLGFKIDGYKDMLAKRAKIKLEKEKQRAQFEQGIV